MGNINYFNYCTIGRDTISTNFTNVQAVVDIGTNRSQSYNDKQE